MPRKLKVYETSQGFFDLAIAAPTKKAALAAWGASPDLFRQGFAQESHDKAVIAAALAQPGVVLRRPVGTNKRFQEKSELPTAESLSEHFKRSEAPQKQAPAPEVAKAGKPQERDKAEKAKSDGNEKAERKAAAAFVKEERKREIQRKKDETAAAKARDRRQAAIKEAKTALETARRQHEEQIALIDKERVALETRAKSERWRKLASSLEASLQKASR